MTHAIEQAQISQRLTPEPDPMPAVAQAVKHGIGHGRIADAPVPVRDRQLAGDLRALAFASPASVTTAPSR